MRWAVVLGLIAHGCDGSPRARGPDEARRPAAAAAEQAPPTATAPGSARFTVATYNVNAGMAGDLSTLSALRELDADVVFLQEATVEWERSVRRELGAVYPHLRELAGFLPALEPWMPTLIVGDLNEAATGKAAARLLQNGFMTALNPATPTWRWETDLGLILNLQLDHILYRGPLALVTSRVVNAGNSDHLPVVATFARPATHHSPR